MAHEDLEEKLVAIGSINSASDILRNSLLTFLLTFNVFENEFFKEPIWNNEINNKEKMPSVCQRCKYIQDEMIKKNSYMFEEVDLFKTQFKKRYIKNNSSSWTEIGKTLWKTKKNPNGYNDELMDRLHKFLVADIRVSKNESIEICLSLCYVFRNNLFHGGKDIRKLEDFHEDFDVISNFLMSLMKELNRIGFEKAWFPEIQNKENKTS